MQVQAAITRHCVAAEVRYGLDAATPGLPSAYYMQRIYCPPPNRMRSLRRFAILLLELYIARVILDEIISFYIVQKD